MTVIQKNKNWIAYIAFAALFVAALIFLFWKCRFGFGTADEAFYLTIPYRLTQGDALFVDEWHISQMSSFLIFPFVKIYMMIAQTTEGMVLAFRYIYISILAVVSLFIFFRFRKINVVGAGAAALCFMLYTPFGISAMSYNSMGIICLTIAAVIVATANKAKNIQMIIAGFFLAGAVLCAPYLLLAYLVFTLVTIGRAIYRKSGKRPLNLSGVYNMRVWLFITIGAAIMAVIFAAFVLSRAKIADIIQAFPYVLNDSEHKGAGIVASLTGYVKGILFANRFSAYIYAVMAVLFLVTLIDKARRKHRAVYFIIAAAVTAALLVSSLGYSRYINFVMFPMNAMAVFCALLVDDFNLRKIFRTVWAAGMMYTLCIHLSSNQAYHAISSSSTVALVGTLVIIGISSKVILSQKKEKKLLQRLVVIATAGLMCLQLGAQTFMRYTSVFDYGFDGESEKMSTVTYLIEEGPNKGIYSKKAHVDEYNAFLDATRSLKSDYPAGTKLFVRSERTYTYLWLKDFKCAAYSPWLCTGFREPKGFQLSIDYFKINPQQIPDLIYLETGEQSGEEMMLQFAGYEEKPLSNGARLWVRK